MHFLGTIFGRSYGTREIRRFFFVLFCTASKLLYCSADLETTIPTQTSTSTSVLWSLAPCQSSFWVPNIPTSFNQNWITYQYEGNPLSKFGDCVFTLESDPNTRIEIVITEVHLFGKDFTFPPPCLELNDVKTDGSIKLLKKECSIILSFNEFEMFPTFTESNVAVITTTIRYGSFQLRARAVPRNFGFPKVSSTPISRPAIDISPATVVPNNNVASSTSRPAVDSLPSVVTILPLFPNNTVESNNIFEKPAKRTIRG